MFKHAQVLTMWNKLTWTYIFPSAEGDILKKLELKSAACLESSWTFCAITQVLDRKTLSMNSQYDWILKGALGRDKPSEAAAEGGIWNGGRGRAGTVEEWR